MIGSFNKASYTPVETSRARSLAGLLVRGCRTVRESIQRQIYGGISTAHNQTNRLESIGFTEILTSFSAGSAAFSVLYAWLTNDGVNRARFVVAPPSCI